MKSYIVMFILAAIFGSCKYYDKNVISVSADGLISECKNNNSRLINKKYELRTVRVAGEILSISYPKEGHLFFDKFYVTFGKLDDNGHLSNNEVYIICSFDNNDNLKYNLSEGSQITLLGKFNRYSNFLFELKHCKINVEHKNSQIKESMGSLSDFLCSPQFFGIRQNKYIWTSGKGMIHFSPD